MKKGSMVKTHKKRSESHKKIKLSEVALKHTNLKKMKKELNLHIKSHKFYFFIFVCYDSFLVCFNASNANLKK